MLTVDLVDVVQAVVQTAGNVTHSHSSGSAFFDAVTCTSHKSFMVFHNLGEKGEFAAELIVALFQLPAGLLQFLDSLHVFKILCSSRRLIDLGLALNIEGSRSGKPRELGGLGLSRVLLTVLPAGGGSIESGSEWLLSYLASLRLLGLLYLFDLLDLLSRLERLQRLDLKGLWLGLQ